MILGFFGEKCGEECGAFHCESMRAQTNICFRSPSDPLPLTFRLLSAYFPHASTPREHFYSEIYTVSELGSPATQKGLPGVAFWPFSAHAQAPRSPAVVYYPSRVVW